MAEDMKKELLAQPRDDDLIQSFIARESIRQQKFQDIWAADLRAAFSDLSSYYDQANTFASMGLWYKWRRSLFSTVDLRPGLRILDICAGTNAIGIELMQRQPGLRIIAVDQSEAMQNVGRRRALERGFKIESVICDVHEIPFPDCYFDAVTLEAASRHLRIFEAFSEVLRVLKPGGYFYHCDMLKPQNKVVAQAYLTYLKTSLLVTGRVFQSAAGVRSCMDYFVDAIREFYTSKELSEILLHLGFSDVSSKTIFYGMVAFHKARKG